MVSMKKSAIAALMASFLFLPARLQAQTMYPSGETATPSEQIHLPDSDITVLQGKGYKVAFLWYTSSDFINAVLLGARDEFARTGVEVVVQTDAGFDTARQRSNIETALATTNQMLF